MPPTRASDTPLTAETARRRKALHAGRSGELAAILLLRAKGYRILARRFLVRGGEIDIVAQRGTSIAFVEVKLRAKLDDAHIAISADKRRRMAVAARAFISRYRLTGLTLRADAIYVAPWRWPRHIPAVFELDLG